MFSSLSSTIYLVHLSASTLHQIQHIVQPLVPVYDEGNNTLTDTLRCMQPTVEATRDLLMEESQLKAPQMPKIIPFRLCIGLRTPKTILFVDEIGDQHHANIHE